MTSKLTNGMKTILTSNLFFNGEDKDKQFTELNIFWLISILFDSDSVEVVPESIENAILVYKKVGTEEQGLIELTGWTYEIFKLSERDKPYEFKFIEATIDFEKKTLIASI